MCMRGRSVAEARSKQLLRCGQAPRLANCGAAVLRRPPAEGMACEVASSEQTRMAAAQRWRAA